MTDWVRYYHDTPTDPKWRVIARKSGQRIGDVIAVWSFVLTNASANANERGRTHNIVTEDIGAALDLEPGQVEAILEAMEGKVIENGKLSAWEKRNPIKDDGAAERAKRWRERKRTQTNGANAIETDKEKENKYISSDFEAFYQTYPRHEAKGQAERAYRAALRTADPPTLLAAAQRYRGERVGQDPKFTKLPATWLNGKCWLDDPPPKTGETVVKFEPTDMQGWRDRVRVFRDMKLWHPKNGPKPGEQGCRVPAEILAEFDLETEAAA
jgi:hypothetical protein